MYELRQPTAHLPEEKGFGQGGGVSAVHKTKSPRTVIYTEVEHEISEWDTEDLQAELMRRGKETPFGYSVSIDELFNAMAFRNHALALELLRKYLMDVTGRILP